MTLRLLDPKFSLARLPTGSSIPEMTFSSAVLSVTYSGREVSILCESGVAPADADIDPDWRVFEYSSDVKSHEVGTVARITGLLAEAGVSVLVVTSYGAGYFAVQDRALDQARGALVDGGVVLS